MGDSRGCRRLHASCHCRNIRATLDWPQFEPPIPARACTCSFCTKHAAAWTSNPGGRFSLTVADEARAARYRFGTRTAEFHICGNCGIVPIVTCSIEGVRYAVFNVRTFEDLDPSELAEAARTFDGEASDARLERRRSHWTPEGAGF